MARLSIVADTSALLHLRQNHWVGWIFVLIGASLCALPRVHPRIDQPWGLYVLGGLFAMLGLLAALHRVDVKLDLLQRRFRITTGFWPNPRVDVGSFDEIEALCFKKRWRRSGGKRKRKYVVWQTALKVAAAEDAVGLHESQDETEARRWFERSAKQLRVKTQDFTTGAADVRDWDRLDDPATMRVAESGRGFTSVDLSRPPEGLSVQQDRDGFVYVAAAPGWTSSAVFGVLAGLWFFLFGVVMLMLGFGLHEYLGWQIRVSGPMAIATAMGAVFVLVGGGIAKLSIGHVRSEQRFAFRGDEFVYATHLPDKLASEERLKYSEIEEFGMRENTARRGRRTATIGGVGMHRWNTPQRPEVFIRTDRTIVTIRDLDPAAASFLVNAFHTHATSRFVRR